MQLRQTHSLSPARLLLFLALLALLILSVFAAGSTAVNSQTGPRLWQVNEAQSNQLVYNEDGIRISYRLPADYRADGRDYRGGMPLNQPLEQTEAQAVNGLRGQGEKFPFGASPDAQRKLLAREKALLEGDLNATNAFGDGEYLGQPQKSLLAVTVEYDPPGGLSTIERLYPVDPEDPSLGCSLQEFSWGPLFLGDDPPPQEGLDNFTFHKEDISLDDYRAAIFGVGPEAGYGVVRDDLGGIDLSGYSLNNYLIEMNPPESPYTTSGDILPESVVLPNAHEYYGFAVFSEDEDGNCVSPTFSDGGYGDHIFDVVDAITAQYDGDATIDWSDFDADGDHIVDLLAVIHAGRGFQEGGGIDRLNTSSSSFSTPQQVVGFTTPADDSDDYFIQGFNIDPEQLDVGAIQEEFEHQFGLPDFYSTDLNNSNAWWTSHSSGVWGGELGATRPMGSGLYASWILGRKDPLVLEWNDPALLAYSEDDMGLTLKLNRARSTDPAEAPDIMDAEGAEDGVIIRLPQGQINITNEAGDGAGWWSDSGDELDNRVYRDFDLSGATGDVFFSFDAAWDIEEDWDYGLIQFSDDGGATWSRPQDEDGILTDQDPNGLGVVVPGSDYGLTGSGSGTLTWDLSSYKGKTVTVMIRYLTDVAVANPGWQVDNILLVDGGGTLYENDLEEDFSDWTNEGWVVVPFVFDYERYYLLEYRVANGFDESLNNPYDVAWGNPDGPETWVNRLPATDEVLIVNYRDQSQGFDYTLSDATFTGQAIGAKFGHLVVDSHPFPQLWEELDADRDDLVGQNVSGRITPGDAGFGLNDTEAWTASYSFDPDTMEPSAPQSWDSDEAVAAFHDSMGYTPGLFYSPDTGFVYFWDEGSSAVLPAKGDYSTPITTVDGDPFVALYGATVGGFPLGTGNPGDDHVHYGLHAEVLMSNEQYAMVRIWNRPYQAAITAAAGVDGLTTFSFAPNTGGKLEDPYLVVELPDGAEYVADSAFGGFMPLGGETVAEALAAAQAGQRATAVDEVQFMVWNGADIGVGETPAPAGFQVTYSGPGRPVYPYDLYRTGTTFVQSGHVQTGYSGPTAWMPLIR